MKWQAIDTAPKDWRPVLVHYKNSHEKGRTVKAAYASKFAIESSADDTYVDYYEARDAYFVPEGWYECVDNWGDLSYLSINEGEPTHWMPLPEPPK